MNASELKSILANEGTTEFAIHPTPIGGKIPDHIPTTVKHLKRQCPRGLVKATVVKDGVQYEEKYTFGCGGDTDHIRTRRNGTLVRFEVKEISVYDEWTGKLNNHTVKQQVNRAMKLPHTTVITEGKKIYIEMIVARRCIVVPWGEYMLVEAEKQKKDERRAQRHDKLDAVANAFPAEIISKRFYDEWFDDRDKKTERYAKAKKNADFFVPKDERWHGQFYDTAYFGQLTIPMGDAQKIVEALDAAKRLASRSKSEDAKTILALFQS